MLRRYRITLLLLLAFVLALSGTALAQDKTLFWERYDVDIKVLSNGNFEIEETQAIRFTSGEFTFGFRAVPLDRIEGIKNIRVFERQGDRLLEYQPSSNETDYTFKTYQESNEQIIYWYFPATQNTRHTYVLSYEVEGALRVYEDGDQVWWKAIGGDHNFPILASVVQVILPDSFASEELVTQSYGTDASISHPNGYITKFTAIDEISAGQEFEVRVQFPHGTVQAAAPSWQQADDASRMRQEQYGPILDIVFLFLGVMLLIGGPLAVYAFWYVRGRDAPAGLTAEYISEPPSDLRPGAAGTLIDEEADLEDIMATMIDLARRGAIHIEEIDDPGFLGIGKGKDFTFHLLDEDIAEKPYEKKLLDKIFGSKKVCEMDSLKNSFYRALPDLRKMLYDDVVEAGFFPRSPKTTRQIYMGLGVAALILSACIGFMLFTATIELSAMAICPTFALVVTCIAFIIAGRHMPRKTREGAEEAARWEAFKRYLKNIEKYGNLEEAQEQFEQYLPYAIAFGIDRNFMRQFAKLDAPAPRWYGPYPPIYMGGHHYPGSFGSASEGGSGAPGPLAGEGKSPTLSDMGRGMGTSLQSMSVGMGAMLTSASRTFTSTPSSSGSGSGGFSGGGFSGGGGGGGGSAGFG